MKYSVAAEEPAAPVLLQALEVHCMSLGWFRVSGKIGELFRALPFPTRMPGGAAPPGLM
ncbi:MAG: hypothetical protein IJN29_00520 [Akkermansia sp.]|nr:hypothetical protein [Akkermansia sp.]